MIDPHHDDERLNRAIRDFLSRYEPEDRHACLTFETDLHQIVRLIYAEAQRPLLKAVADSLDMRPPAPIVIPKPEQ